MRVTDEMVRQWLAWTRNFGEVVAYNVGTGSGRRFRVRLTAGITRDGAPFRPKQGILDITGHDAEDVVPAEMMLTAREAMVFAFGCAVGRTTALAGSDEMPAWRIARNEEWTPAERAAFEQRRQEAKDANEAEMERERAEREAERQRRMAEYRRRRESVRQIEEGRS